MLLVNTYLQPCLLYLVLIKNSLTLSLGLKGYLLFALIRTDPDAVMAISLTNLLLVMMLTDV